jgi:phytoene dehydrogenase-like protein
MSDSYDAVVIGSGINSLAAGALLARAGWGVCVLERNDYLGGAIRTAEITEPGYLHETLSSWHPLWVGGPAHAQLGDDLAARGLEYLNTDLPTATLYPDGEAAFLLRTADANAAELDRYSAGDGDAWGRMLDEFFPNADLAFGVLGTELWSPSGVSLASRAYRRLGRRGLLAFGGSLLTSARDWLTETFASERAHGLIAPWVLHTGLGPDDAASGYMARVIAVAIQEGGMPVPRGGGIQLVEALAGMIRDAGGELQTGRDVDRVVVEDGRAQGVRTTEGELVRARRAVLANVTPTQLYGRLLPEVDAPVREAAGRFRYGRCDMQIHFALSEPPRWEGDERLGGTALVHLTPGLDGVSRAVNEATRGLLPAEATVVVGQPLTMDASRAPDGAGMLWIQLQELPWHVKGDAAGEIEETGEWTESLRERYADRIQARIARHIPNLESSIRKRVVLSPADLAAIDVNLERGDPYAGSLSLDQNFLWRPLREQPGHATPVPGLWHIGASTHPGPGLGGGSGALVAEELLRPPLPQRAIAGIRSRLGV